MHGGYQHDVYSGYAAGGVEPIQGAFDDPAPFAKELARFDAIAGNTRWNASAKYQARWAHEA